MNKTVSIIVAIVATIGLGVGLVALTKNSNHTSTPSTAASSTPNINSVTPTENTTPPINVDQGTQNRPNAITYTSSGFNPATLNVKAGSTITIKNESSRILQFDSDPHPQHTDDPELNIGSVSPGQSKTVTVTKTGSHGYHNHLNDNDTGILIVE